MKTFYIKTFYKKITSKINYKNSKKILKSYNKLKETKNSNLIPEIIDQLSNTKFLIPQYKFKKFILGEAIDYAEIALRQFFIATYLSKNLNKKLLLSLSGNNKIFFYPLPLSYLKIIRTYNIKVSFPISRLLFFLSIFKTLLNTILFKIFTFVKLFKNFEKSHIEHIQFMDLSISNLSINDKEGGIINWYINYYKSKVEVTQIYHNVNNVPDNRINKISISYNGFNDFGLNIYTSCCFFFWMINATLISLFDLLRGRWWHAFLLKQSVMSKKFSYLTKDQIAKKYLFSNSSWLVRPLWTYEATKLGSEIILYFYSTNNESVIDRTEKAIIGLGYSTMNWPKYLVWDIYQSNFIKNVAHKYANIEIVGPIDFISSPKHINIIKCKSIAVFDVSPGNNLESAILGAQGEYYTYKNVFNFLIDIYEIANKFDIKIRFKIKRSLTNRIDKRYIKLLSKLEKYDNIEFINPIISANKVIESCSMTISFPFTSTSIIAKELNLPTVYYDSTGRLQKDDPGAHGVMLLSNKIELENWVLNNLI